MRGGSGAAGRSAEEVNASGKWAHIQYGKNLKLGPTNSTETLGWRPTCACPPHEPVPCSILDCFAGSGTTGLVADRLGRDATLIDLSPAYQDLAVDRLEADAGLFSDIQRKTPAPAESGGEV